MAAVNPGSTRERLVRDRTESDAGVGVFRSLWNDIEAIMAVTIPMFLSRVSWITMKFTDSALLGRAGTEYLEAVALSELWSSSIGVFMSSGCMGMLAGQAYGAGNKKLVGIWLQVAYVVLGVAALFVTVGRFFTGMVLRYFGQSDEMSADAQYFVVVLTLAVPFRIAAGQLDIFFSCQKIVRPTSVSAVCAMSANLALGLFFVLGVPVPGWSGYGFSACPWVTAGVEAVQFMCFWVVTCWLMKWHVECWGGWDWSVITKARVWTYLEQYVPRTLSLASDFWRVSAIGAVASSLGDAEVAVWNTSYRICWLCLVFVGSLSAGMAIRVNIALGAGQVNKVKREMFAGLAICCTLLIVLCVIITTIPRHCGMIFSNDPEILDLFEEASWALAFWVGSMNLSVLLERIPATLGKPKLTLWAGVVGSWAGQVPGAYFCTRYWRNDSVGLYTGSAIGYMVLNLILAVACLSFDWPELVAKARERSEMPAISQEQAADDAEQPEAEPAGEGQGQGLKRPASTTV